MYFARRCEQVLVLVCNAAVVLAKKIKNFQGGVISRSRRREKKARIQDKINRIQYILR